MRQSGFTLIELLLVLAIIGIISAIAIPALLSQRSRARDKASITNTVSHLSDLVGQYDLAKENGGGPTSITNAMRTYLQNTLTEKDPWNNTVTTMNNNPFAVNGAQTNSDFEGVMSPSPYKGRGRVFVQFATSAQPGFLGVILRVHNVQNGSTIVRKSTAIE